MYGLVDRGKPAFPDSLESSYLPRVGMPWFSFFSSSGGRSVVEQLAPVAEIINFGSWRAVRKDLMGNQVLIWPILLPVQTCQMLVVLEASRVVRVYSESNIMSWSTDNTLNTLPIEPAIDNAVLQWRCSNQVWAGN